MHQAGTADLLAHVRPRPARTRQVGTWRLTALVSRNIVEMKVRELIRMLTADGWYLARSRGSHNQFKHPTKAGVVTVAGSGGDDLAPKTLKSILKQARLTP